MKAVVIYPKNEEQVDAIKAFAKALKMDFKVTKDESPYDHSS